VPNSNGLALNANGLGGRFDDSIGMPQTVIRRAVLDAHNIADALKALDLDQGAHPEQRPA